MAQFGNAIAGLTLQQSAVPAPGWSQQDPTTDEQWIVSSNSETSYSDRVLDYTTSTLSDQISVNSFGTHNDCETLTLMKLHGVAPQSGATYLVLNLRQQEQV